ncbi:hypothetical protein TorRG33x02_200860 [Trema orientale]|uniref:Uncharacterized protein n=1 Tax=Trema orientale TaxID=63057 RepID=A0A2P5EEY0_TREOI|nr:hypothetical protein TorRG33x02_200860 [Trema orientale]
MATMRENLYENEEKLKELERVTNELSQTKNNLSQLQKDFHGIPRLNTAEFKEFVDKFKEDSAGNLMYILLYHHKKINFLIVGEKAVKLVSNFVECDKEEVILMIHV